MSRSRPSAKAFGELYVRPVVAPDGDSLGWAVCVLIEDPLPNTTVGRDGANSQRADLLTVKLCRFEWEALSAEQGLQDFLLNDRRLIADLAFPRELWEWIAWPQIGSTNLYWTELQGDELVDFRTGRRPILCAREDWNPSQQDLLAEVFEGQPDATYLANKVRRMLNESTMDPRGRKP
jgi:hypothetical protein